MTKRLGAVTSRISAVNGDVVTIESVVTYNGATQTMVHDVRESTLIQPILGQTKNNRYGGVSFSLTADPGPITDTTVEHGTSTVTGDTDGTFFIGLKTVTTGGGLPGTVTLQVTMQQKSVPAGLDLGPLRGSGSAMWLVAPLFAPSELVTDAATTAAAPHPATWSSSAVRVTRRDRRIGHGTGGAGVQAQQSAWGENEILLYDFRPRPYWLTAQTKLHLDVTWEDFGGGVVGTSYSGTMVADPKSWIGNWCVIYGDVYGYYGDFNRSVRAQGFGRFWAQFPLGRWWWWKIYHEHDVTLDRVAGQVQALSASILAKCLACADYGVWKFRQLIPSNTSFYLNVSITRDYDIIPADP